MNPHTFNSARSTTIATTTLKFFFVFSGHCFFADADAEEAEAWDMPLSVVAAAAVL